MNQKIHSKIFLTGALVLLNIIFLSAAANAQLDPTFGTNGTTVTDVSSVDIPSGAFTLPGDKILVFSQGTNGSGFHFVRYNSDGSPDATYGMNGVVTLPIPNTTNEIYGIARQSDGKFVLVGVDGNNGIVVRLNEDGTLDTSFNGTGIHRPNINQSGLDYASAVVIQPDGKIIIGGFTNTPSGGGMYLLRYHPNGLLDLSFGNEGYFIYNFGVLHALYLQSNGKIIASSASARYYSTGGVIRRFNSDASVDNSFSVINFTSSILKVSTLQADDKIVTAEEVDKTETLERAHTNIRVSRYNADGTADTNFGTSGSTSFDITTFFNDSPNALKILSDGQILVSGITYVQPNRSKTKGYYLTLARLSSGGAVNGKFLETNTLFTGDAFLLPMSDGKIVTVFGIQQANFNLDILLTRAVNVPLQTYKFRAVPFDFGFGFDGVADVSVFRPADRKWYIYQTYPGFFFGLSDDIPVPSDYIRDFATELAVFRPSNGKWYIARTLATAATDYIEVQWGLNGDIPVPADYDGDSKTDIAVFRPSNGVWYIRNSADNSNTILQWGLNGDKPVPGDFDGDGFDDIAVFRPSDGNWYILKSSNSQALVLHFGLNGDFPVQEDYDGDGKFDIAVYRPTDGVWYRLNSSDGSFFALQWAVPADIPVPADYDGDGKSDIAVWRSTAGRWYVYQSSTNSMAVYTWGTMSDVPLPRKF
jgi:uncharacterized delta-60 repeat protein